MCGEKRVDINEKYLLKGWVLIWEGVEMMRALSWKFLMPRNEWIPNTEYLLRDILFWSLYAEGSRNWPSLWTGKKVFTKYSSNFKHSNLRPVFLVIFEIKYLREYEYY